MRRCQVGSAVIMRSRDLSTEDDAGLLKRLLSSVIFMTKLIQNYSFLDTNYSVLLFCTTCRVCLFCVLYHTVLQTEVILILLNYFSLYEIVTNSFGGVLLSRQLVLKTGGSVLQMRARRSQGLESRHWIGSKILN